MLIGVVSDTHMDKVAIEKISQILKDTDMIIHLGDNVKDVQEIKKYYKNKIISVRGNCDFRSDAPFELLEEIDGNKILITHGHNYDVKYSELRLMYRAKEVGANIVLFGHTHVSKIQYEEGIWFINPGSPSLPRKGGKSIALIDINGKNVKPYIKLL